MSSRPLPVLDRAAAKHLEPRRESYELCAYCPKMCRFSCPVAEADARETLTPWGKMSAPFLAMTGTQVPLETAFETSWACTGCGHCTDYCAHGNDVPPSLAAARAAGVAAGLHAPIADEISQSFREHGNPCGEPVAPRLRELTPLALRSEDKPTLFLPGCEAPLRAAGPTRAAMKILERLGDEAVGVSPECCGAALWWAGLPERFDAHAKAFARRMRKRRTLVVADAQCAWALRVLYPRRGVELAPEVVHLTEWLAPFFAERVLKPKKLVAGSFWYHDPCQLARGLEVTEEPRIILRAILQDAPREFAWNRRDAMCCGAGALLPRSMPETSKRMAARRVEEPLAIGGTIVTSCPSCLGRLATEEVETVDLTELVAKAL